MVTMRLFSRSTGTNFYQSKQWRALREWALSRYGAVCMRCRSTNSIEVDHIKSRSRHHRLRLRKSNVQILCKPCNQAKGSIDSTDYRPILTRGKYGMIKSVKRIIQSALLVFFCLLLWRDLAFHPFSTTLTYVVLSDVQDFAYELLKYWESLPPLSPSLE